MAVIGNASAAIDGALTLTGYASKVYLINRELVASPELIVKLKESSVETVSGTWVAEIAGEDGVQSLVLENGEKLPLDGVFIELGAKGAMELALELGIQLDLDTMSHIDTNKKQRPMLPGSMLPAILQAIRIRWQRQWGKVVLPGWKLQILLKNRRETRRIRHKKVLE